MAKEFYIGDFLKRIKRPVDLEPEREYKLVTIKMNHKGVVLRELKKGALIKSKMYKVQEGDFILSGIDARNGAFGIVPKELDGAIVTNDFWYFEINEEIISKRLFLELTATSWFDEICKRGSDGTTQRIRLQKDKFFNQKVLLPGGNEQEKLLSKILTFKKGQSNLESEIQKQKELVAQLKQSILQEAIQGKLTEDWRKDHPNLEPASELLKRIKAEKEKLIKEKKIRKEKPLQPITDEETPFKLPEGWVWCRLGEIYDVKRGKGPKYSSTGIAKMINQKCVRWFDVETLHCKTVDKKWLSLLDPSFKVITGDLLVNSTGEGTIGRAAMTNEKCDGFAFDSHVLRVRPYTGMSTYVLALVINSNFGQGLIEGLKGAKTTKQTELGVNNLSNFLIPLASVEEQDAIIERVETLMERCHALELEISLSEQHSQMLMPVLLKEAFENNPAETLELSMAAEPETEYKSSATLPIPPNKKGFAKLVLAGKIISMCKDSPEFTNIKFQKLQHLAEHLMEADLNLNYYNQAAGPYDNRFMHTLHNKMSQQKWFGSQSYKYAPLEKSKEIDGHFSRYFGARAEQFLKLIKLLGKATEDQCEIISTLYAVWNDRIIKGEPTENDLLIKDFFNWSERKHKYTAKQLNDAIQWMRDNELEPTGFGELIKHAKKKKP